MQVKLRILQFLELYFVIFSFFFVHLMCSMYNEHFYPHSALSCCKSAYIQLDFKKLHKV